MLIRLEFLSIAPVRISACPFTTASQGPRFLLRFESRRGPASHHLGKLSQEVRSGSGRLGTEPCLGRDLRLLSPSDTHLAWRRVELHSSHTGTRGPHAEPPQQLVSPSPQSSWQRGTGKRRAVFQHPHLLLGPHSGSYSIFTTQWYVANVFLPRRQKYVSSSHSCSLWEISVVCKEM